jgi:hypothetical protein
MCTEAETGSCEKKEESVAKEKGPTQAATSRQQMEKQNLATKLNLVAKKMQIVKTADGQHVLVAKRTQTEREQEATCKYKEQKRRAKEEQRAANKPQKMEESTAKHVLLAADMLYLLLTCYTCC